MYLAIQLDTPRTLDGVLEAMERATVLDPRNAEAWHQLGGILMVQLRDPAGTRRAFDRALALDPQMADATAALGLTMPVEMLREIHAVLLPLEVERNGPAELDLLSAH